MKIYVRVTDNKNQTYEGIAELTKSKKQKTQKLLDIKISGATGIIKLLYNQNYFETERTLNAIEQKIKSKKYNLPISSIAVTLDRASYLQRKGKRGNYSYIQKAPPN